MSILLQVSTNTSSTIDGYNCWTCSLYAWSFGFGISYQILLTTRPPPKKRGESAGPQASMESWPHTKVLSSSRYLGRPWGKMTHLSGDDNWTRVPIVRNHHWRLEATISVTIYRCHKDSCKDRGIVGCPSLQSVEGEGYYLKDWWFWY